MARFDGLFQVEDALKRTVDALCQEAFAKYPGDPGRQRDALLAVLPDLAQQYGDAATEWGLRYFNAARIEHGLEVTADSVSPPDVAGEAYDAIRQEAGKLWRGDQAGFADRIGQILGHEAVTRPGVDAIMRAPSKETKRYQWVAHGLKTCKYCASRAGAPLDTKDTRMRCHDNCHCTCDILFYDAAGRQIKRLVGTQGGGSASNSRGKTAGSFVDGLPKLKDSPIISERSGRNLEALRRLTNPNYRVKPGYDDNCQRVVHAYELRRRGYLVTAKPNPGDDWAGWQDALDGLRQRFNANAVSFGSGQRQAAIDHVENIIKGWKKGDRGYVWIDRPNAPGHVFNVEWTGTRLKVIEAQNPDTKSVTLKHYIDQANWVSVAKVNDLDFNDLVEKAVY